MAGTGHALICPQCQGKKFREEKIVEIDASVVVREDLPVSARTVSVEYRYICISCGHILNEPWSGHHE